MNHSQEAPLRSIQAPPNMWYRCYSNLGTIVFSITRPGELAMEYQVYHVNTGGFRRFSETEVVEAARELALHFVGRAGAR
jgi:hypothetical protein